MKYFMLAQWVAEHNNLKSVINRIYKVRDAVVIRFESGRYLVFHYLTNAPLLYVTDKVNYDLKNAQTIWTNLQNAIVSSVSISENDRIITFSLSHKDIYQKVNEYCLIYECMPPKANLILCREQSGILLISDAVVKYTYADNPQRQILAGLPYEPPRTAFKPDFSKLSYPIILKLPEQDKDIACQSVNEYFIAYQKYIVEKQEATLQKKRLENRWNKALHKAEKKLQLQQQELEQAELESTWLLYSELLKVNLQNVRKGDDCLLTTNYYDSNLASISIPLLKEKSPQENLNFYLKKYRKAKQGKEKLASQIKQTYEEISQIKSILVMFESNIWQDLITQDADVFQTTSHLKKADNLFRLPVNKDWEIVIGRKATENDFISTQLGKPNDWWFHTRIYRGSHILLRNYHKLELPPPLCELCCRLAAWFSKARNSSNVPVDYTQIRFVRKPRKSAPGYVTYSSHKTIFAEPLEPAAAKEVIRQYVEQD